MHRISIENTGENFRCDEDRNVLAAMEQASCHGIPVGCRNGGCGACKVRIISGHYHTRKMNRAVLSAAEECDGCALACRTYPHSDLFVQALGRAWRDAKPIQGTSFSFELARTTPISQPDKET